MLACMYRSNVNFFFQKLGPTTPHQADPFASSYMHPSGQNSQPQRQDPFGNQSSAQPSHGQTPFEQRQSDQSSFGQPSFGQPSHGQMSFGQPQNDQSSFGQPSFGQPSHGPASFAQAPNGQPSYDQPQFHLSSAGQPPFGQSAVGQPSPYVQAGQMPQQQASGSGPSASHNPFAAGFGGSSFGNSGKCPTICYSLCCQLLHHSHASVNKLNSFVGGACQVCCAT